MIFKKTLKFFQLHSWFPRFTTVYTEISPESEFKIVNSTENHNQVLLQQIEIRLKRIRNAIEESNSC